MKFNVTKPIDMMSNPEEMLPKVIEKFQSKFYGEKKDQSYYHLIIEGEIPRHICDDVERIYRDAGWGKVSCTTSSENGERRGLTGLRLWVEK